MKLLVEDLPWSHKPLLLALIDLLAIMTSSSDDGDQAMANATVTVGGVTIVDETDLFMNASPTETTNNISARDAAESLAPALLRPPPKNHGRGGATGMAQDGTGSGETGVGWEEELAATSVVELLLSERDSVFDGLRAEQASRWGEHWGGWVGVSVGWRGAGV